MGRIHQPVSRTFFVFFSKICKFECNTTSDWLMVLSLCPRFYKFERDVTSDWLIQSVVVLFSTASKHRTN